jgi:hypothetical protein
MQPLETSQGILKKTWPYQQQKIPMAQLIYKSEIAKDNALQIMFKMKLVLHILKATSRTANICTCELRYYAPQKLS